MNDTPPDKYHVPEWLGTRAPRRFHAMAKPAGAACNLDCTYCFYLSKHDLAGGPGPGHMRDDVLECFVRDYIAGVTTDEVVFTWQGGEPTLRGIAFYEKVVALQRRYARPGQRVENDLQTNGVLIDEDWAKFLKANRFLVGLSIDGPKDVHDALRVSKQGKPTFDAVMTAAQLLKRHGVSFNTLTCVHRYNATRPLDVYRFLRRELGSTYLQFIPIVERNDFRGVAPARWDAATLPVSGSPQARPGHPQSVVTDWSVDPEEYGYFLCKVWDEWQRRDVGKAFVNFCETLVAQHMGEPSQICVFSETCGKAVVVEHDGGVFSCDHFVYPEYRLGDVRSAALADLVFSPRQVKFGYDKSDTLPEYCRRCEFLNDCWGECPKNRFVRTPDGEPGLNYLCPAFKTFFAHAVPQAHRMAVALGAAPTAPPASR